MRVACLVPHCRRTKRPALADAAAIAAGRVYEWVCGDHWRGVPRELRRLFFRARRRNRPWLEEHLWRRCKAAAIERAMGI